MKTIVAIIVALLFAVPCIAVETRGGAGTPWLPPDPSLKTNDPFYQGMMERQYGIQNGNMAANDPWAGLINSSAPTMPVNAPDNSEDAFWDMSEHNKKLKNEGHVWASDAYGLTEEQLGRAGIELGKEAWL